jgi:transcriptional regulator with XRE-family HTH domain
MGKEHGPSAQVLANNLAALIKEREWNYRKLGQESGMSGRMIGLIMKCESFPTIGTLDKIARAFSLCAWHLLIPNLKSDLIETGQLHQLMENFRHSDQDGRDHISFVAKREAQHAKGN